jgi:hypothetical protein
MGVSLRHPQRSPPCGRSAVWWASRYYIRRMLRNCPARISNFFRQRRVSVGDVREKRLRNAGGHQAREDFGGAVQAGKGFAIWMFLRTGGGGQLVGSCGYARKGLRNASPRSRHTILDLTRPREGQYSTWNQRVRKCPRRAARPLCFDVFKQRKSRCQTASRNFFAEEQYKESENIPPSGVTSSSRLCRSAMERRVVNVVSKIYVPMGEEQEWPREL